MEFQGCSSCYFPDLVAIGFELAESDLLGLSIVICDVDDYLRGLRGSCESSLNVYVENMFLLCPNYIQRLVRWGNDNERFEDACAIVRFKDAIGHCTKRFEDA